ncbi:unnamed protein product [Lactuca saligna]|uniref:Uncharacterized protein n=1 Tax=Lactuca saligna TaxID=75948 RepID=A0AA35ZK33_LACSI|nr:unnamed protein product [Lactuca saligna]
MAKLLGGIGDILGGQFSVQEKREVVVVPSSLGASPSRSAGSPLVNPGLCSGWLITRNSLLSEDTTAQEWSRCVCPPVTMSSLVGKPSACMADDLCYTTAHTSVLMVVAAERVRLAGASQGQLKVL